MVIFKHSCWCYVLYQYFDGILLFHKIYTCIYCFDGKIFYTFENYISILMTIYLIHLTNKYKLLCWHKYVLPLVNNGLSTMFWFSAIVSVVSCHIGRIVMAVNHCYTTLFFFFFALWSFHNSQVVLTLFMSHTTICIG